MENWNQQLETKRQEFLRFYKKFRNWNTIIMVLVVLLILPIMMYVMPQPNWGTWTALLAVMLLMGGLFIYGQYMKKKTNARAKEYIDEYYQMADNYIFNDPETPGYQQDSLGKFTTEQFVNAHILLDIEQSASRNLVSYQIGERKVAMSDYVAYTYGTGRHKKLNPLFVGKFFEADNNISEGKRTLIFLKPKIKTEGASGPNDHADLNTLMDDDDIAIYSTYKRIDGAVGKDILSVLDKIKIGDDIVDVSISLTAGKTYVALSCSNRLMNVPLETPINIEAVNAYKNAVSQINELIAKVK